MNATLPVPPTTSGINHSAPPLHPPGADNAEAQRLQDWIAQINALPDGEARQLIFNCLQSILALHHDGLSRVLQLVKNNGAAGAEIVDALARDRLVRGLLLIHGLHPAPLETRLHAALDKVRPYMQSHGGDVELIQLENERARLRLHGACKTCPSSTITMELAVRQAVEEACPDLLGFELENAVPPPAAPVQQEAVC